jgi:hypothetical protein
MKKVYISYCTEHEFGQRPDGYMVSDDLYALTTIIAENVGTGNKEQYFTYTDPMEVWCSKKTFNEIQERKTRNSKGTIAFYEDNVKLKLYKRI